MTAINIIRDKCNKFNTMHGYIREHSNADTVYQVATVAAVLLLLGSFVAL